MDIEGKIIIRLSELSEKLMEYKTILFELEKNRISYERKREILSKLTQRKKGSRKPNEVCFMCNANIDFDDTKSFTICKGCERFVCKSEKCAEWIQSIGIWECGKCQAKRVDHTKASEWLLQQLNFRIRHPGPADLKNEKLFIGNESDDTRSTTSSITSNQRIKVREFIEELLASILKGSLDDVTVGPVSKNREYIRIFQKYHSRLSQCLFKLELAIHRSLSDLPLWEGEGEKCPGDNHIELKRLIQSIIEEVSKIPELLGVVDYPNQKEPILPFFDPKKYEQLLATAVLNKVVETYRNNKNFPDNQSSGVHTDSELDNNHNVKGKRNLSTEKSISDNAKQISMAINDPKQKNDLNNFSRRASDTDESYLSDYIQKHKVPLPDLSSDSTSGGEVEDDAISLKSNGTDGTWEENWLFKKRQLKMSETSIAMLVPSPTEDIKALIGDKNADEVSDLSEAGSDAEDECDGHHKQFEKPTVISPESKSVDSEGIHPDSLTLFNSIPSSEQILSEAKNDVLLIDSSQAINNHVEIKMNGKLNIDLLEFEAVNTTIHKQPEENVTQKEIGKNEKLLLLEDENNCAAEDNELALITDDCKIMNEISDNSVKHLSDLGNNVEIQEQKIPVPSPRTHTPSSELSEKFEQRKPKVFARSAQSTTSDSNNNIQSEDSLEQDILIPGSIAEREHLKWKNAAPIANNPYSPDALKKRLSEVERKSQFSDLGRITPDKMIENLAGDIGQETIIHPVLDSESVDVNKYGRDYYINSAKFASGAARKRFSDLSSLSQSTDDEKVSESKYFHTNSFLLDKFLSDDNAKAKLKQNNRCFVKKPASLDLNHTHRPLSCSSSSDFEIPDNVLKQFEKEMVHNNFRRDSFRARNSSKHFVLNPIFDEAYYTMEEESGQVELRKPTVKHVRKIINRNNIENGSRSESDYESIDYKFPNQTVETVFTDLGTLRRSASIRDSRSRVNLFAKRTNSLRNDFDRQI